MRRRLPQTSNSGLPARNGSPVLAFVTATNNVLDKIYPLPEGDEADLPVKRIDALQAHGLEVNVAFAGTPAADDLLRAATVPVPLATNAC